MHTTSTLERGRLKNEASSPLGSPPRIRASASDGVLARPYWSHAARYTVTFVMVRGREGRARLSYDGTEPANLGGRGAWGAGLRAVAAKGRRPNNSGKSIKISAGWQPPDCTCKFAFFCSSGVRRVLQSVDESSPRNFIVSESKLSVRSSPEVSLSVRRYQRNARAFDNTALVLCVYDAPRPLEAFVALVVS